MLCFGWESATKWHMLSDVCHHHFRNNKGRVGTGTARGYLRLKTRSDTAAVSWGRVSDMRSSARLSDHLSSHSGSGGPSTRPASLTRTSPCAKQTPAGEEAEPSGANRGEKSERSRRGAINRAAELLLPFPVWFSLARNTHAAKLARWCPRFYLEL